VFEILLIVMNEPKTFVVWSKTVLEWDEEWDPRIVLRELAWFLDEMGVDRFKLRVTRRSKFWSSKLTGKNVVVVTDVPHLYSRRTVEEAFGGWHVERVVDGFLLVRLEAFLEELEVLEMLERVPEAVPVEAGVEGQKARATVG
jgi:hypothetical protein